MNLRPVWPYNESIAHKTKQQQESVRLLLSIHPWFKLLWRGMTGNQCLFLGTSSPKPGFVWAWTLMRWFPKGLANSNAQASLHGTTVSSTGFLLNQHYLVAVFSIPEYKNKSCSWEEWEWTQEKSRKVLSSNLPQDCNTLPSRQPVITNKGPVSTDISFLSLCTTTRCSSFSLLLSCPVLGSVKALQFPVQETTSIVTQ